MATITDVARVAGVSVSTVSHVVNGTRVVRDPTRERVQKAIADTGYSRDGIARALRRSKTEAIGLVVTETGQPGFAEMIRGVEEEARANGLTLLLANSAENPERELASVQALLERRVDGLLLAPVGGSPHSLVESVLARQVPIVLIDRLSAPDVDQVGVETIAPMKLLVRHLIELGHRRIALLGGDDQIPTLRERREGYSEALAEAGLPATIRVVAGPLQDTAVKAQESIRALLVGPQPPTALVAASQLLAVGALRALAELGLRVPRDVAVVVFDEFPYPDLLTPRLTSVASPNMEVGREATRLLVGRIHHPEMPVATVRLKPQVFHRESCGCPESTSGGILGVAD
jgi:LacI family transcriptional regulator